MQLARPYLLRHKGCTLRAAYLLVPHKLQTGDVIAIAPTDYVFDQAEEFVIERVAPIEGSTSVRLTLTQALAFNHNGERYSTMHKGTGSNMVLDARAEVAMLTRCVATGWGG